MKVPDWWEFALLGLASWRVFKLLADDVILDKPRAWFVFWFRKWRGNKSAEYVSDFISCPYCLGFWCALAWWGGYEFSPHWSLVAATPFALSALLVAAERLISGPS